jgi:polyadenylation factor subunit 2
MGAPPPPPGFQVGGPVGGAGEGFRRRAPLPDQNEALELEMRQGRFRKAR